MHLRCRFYLAVCYVALSLVSHRLAAQSSFVQQYNVEARQNKAYLRWIISSGNTCNGIEISRSTDGVNYTLIGQIFGICGSADSAQTFEYTDNSPEKDKTNYYRLAFGYQGQTAVQSVFVLGEGGYILYPNPASNKFRLRFNNATNSIARLNMFDISGRIVLSLSKESDILDIDVIGLPQSIYFFVLKVGDSAYTGKVCVIR